MVSGNVVQGFYAQALGTPSENLTSGTIRGGSLVGFSLGGSDAYYVIGGTGTSRHQGTGAVTEVRGLEGRIQVDGNGVIAAGHAFVANNLQLVSGTGTVTKLAGVSVVNQTGGTAGNVNALLGTTTIPSGNYSLYSSNAYQS